MYRIRQLFVYTEVEMKINLGTALSVFALLLASCSGPRVDPSSENGSVDSEETSFSGEDIFVERFQDLPELRFSSFSTNADKGKEYLLKMKVPYSGKYKITLSNVSNYQLYDTKGNLLHDFSADFQQEFQEGELLYIRILAAEEKRSLDVNVSCLDHLKVLPYDPINAPDVSSFEITSVNSSSPLKASELNYSKRNDGSLYVNCNNPEKLTDADLNKALTRNALNNQEVFFTFEHNNAVSGLFYYGYQVRNTGEKDLYLTIKNLGFQLMGEGAWYGEKEWVDFYNTDFRVKGIDSFTARQESNYVSYFGFSNKYVSEDHQPITYRVPSGKHIYVMGGTTADAYNKTSVYFTANKRIGSGCSNGAVLFDVHGQAEGAFYIYRNPADIQEDNKTHQGYITTKEGDDVQYGAQYVGYDNCNGVVDNQATWIFNDNDERQHLPVAYTNYYADDVPSLGEPYAPIASTAHLQEATSWVTHLNPQSYHTAVGTDMTKYYTVKADDGSPIVIDNDHYDGRGCLANLGNWMMDYIDTFTFVNQGDRDRNIVVEMTNNGSVACLVREQDGSPIKGTEQYTIGIGSTSYGDAIDDHFKYTRLIPSHSVVQFHVEYNLLANSYGCVNHSVELL